MPSTRRCSRLRHRNLEHDGLPMKVRIPSGNLQRCHCRCFVRAVLSGEQLLLKSQAKGSNPQEKNRVFYYIIDAAKCWYSHSRAKRIRVIPRFALYQVFFMSLSSPIPFFMDSFLELLSPHFPNSFHLPSSSPPPLPSPSPAPRISITLIPPHLISQHSKSLLNNRKPLPRPLSIPRVLIRMVHQTSLPVRVAGSLHSRRVAQ